MSTNQEDLSSVRMFTSVRMRNDVSWLDVLSIMLVTTTSFFVLETVLNNGASADTSHLQRNKLGEQKNCSCTDDYWDFFYKFWPLSAVISTHIYTLTKMYLRFNHNTK